MFGASKYAFYFIKSTKSFQKKHILLFLAKLTRLAKLDSKYKRIVVVCTTEETAKFISNSFLVKYNMENLLNQSKAKISYKVRYF